MTMADDNMHWKFLDHRGSTVFSGFEWPLPRGEAPGPWVEALDAIRPCTSGIHACRRTDLSWWLSADLWAIELGGPVRSVGNKVVAPRGRLLRRVADWPAAGALLANWALWRCRDHLVSALGALGRLQEATALAGAETSEGLREVAIALGPDPENPVGLTFSLAVHCADAYPNPVSVAFSCATAAGHAATATTTDRATYQRAFGAERHAQSLWLADRLGL